MAEATYTTTTRVPVDAIWDFVQEMDHWARFVPGYQAHQKASDSESTWTLKGDLGVMSRTLTFRVVITEWRGPEQVRFTLEGRNEPMTGEGAFRIETATPAAPSLEVAGAAGPAAPRRGRLLRLLEAFWRRVLRAIGGRVERAAPPAPAAGEAVSRMTFSLRLVPGGPMAPMIEAMIRPMMLPAAEDLASRILAHLEGIAAAGSGRSGTTEATPAGKPPAGA